MTGAEGKMFRPLAYTKTFVLIASVLTALTIIPAVAHVLIAGRVDSKRIRRALSGVWHLQRWSSLLSRW
jgi:copper/silver efflux system protein